MRDDYRQWLVEQGYPDNSVASRIANAHKVEKLYGNLEDLFANGGYQALVDELTYSTEDTRRKRANPSRIQTEGDLRNNLATYKQGVALYRRFLSEVGTAPRNAVAAGIPAFASEGVAAETAGLEKQRLALERDMQAALRRDITRLEPGLQIIDDGVERYVASGFIDILCKDAADRVVVVELKAGKSDPRVIGQTLGYIGDLMDEDSVQAVRGIIVAHDFDQRTRSAARAVATLSLFTYAVAFTFQAVL